MISMRINGIGKKNQSETNIVDNDLINDNGTKYVNNVQFFSRLAHFDKIYRSNVRVIEMRFTWRFFRGGTALIQNETD